MPKNRAVEMVPVEERGSLIEYRRPLRKSERLESKVEIIHLGPTLSKILDQMIDVLEKPYGRQEIEKVPLT